MSWLKRVLIGLVVLALLIGVGIWAGSLHHEEVRHKDIPWSPSPTYVTEAVTQPAVSPAKVKSYRLHGVVRHRKLKARSRMMYVASEGRRVPVTYRASQVMWVGYGSGPNANRELVKKWQNIYWDFRYEGHFAHKPYATTGWWVNEAVDTILIGWRHSEDQGPDVYHGVYNAEWCPYRPLYPNACIPWWHQDSASTFDLCVLAICRWHATIWTSQRVTPRHHPLGYSENAWRS